MSKVGQQSITNGLLPWLRALMASPQSLAGQLVRGVVGTAGVKVAARLLGLFAGILLARWLGAEGYGIYSFALAIVTLLAIPGQLGLPHFVVRQVAVYLGRGNLSLIKGLLESAAFAVIITGGVLASVAALIVLFWVSESGAVNPDVLIWAFATLPFIGLCGILSASVRGLGYVVLGQIPDDLVRPIAFLCTLSAFVLVGLEVDAKRGVQLYLAATVTATAVGGWSLIKLRPVGFSQTQIQRKICEWAAGALPFLVLAGTYAVTQQSDIVMLGVMAEAAEVGVYRVAAIMAPLVVFGLTLVETAIAPHLAMHHDAGNLYALQKIISAAALAALLMGGAVATVFIFSGRLFLPLIFGAEFSVAAGPLAILASGYLIAAATGPGAMALAMTGNVWIGAVAVGVAGVLNIALNLVLIPYYGSMGAASATAVSIALANLALVYGLYRKTGLVCLPWWRGRQD